MLLDFIKNNLIAHAAPKTTDSGIVKGLTGIFGDFEDILKFGLQIGAAIAFITILYAGFLYLTGADNASKQKEAKSWIISAAEGLAVLTFGYLILTTINPNLLDIKEIPITYYQDDIINDIPLATYKFDNSKKIIGYLPVADANAPISDVFGYRFLPKNSANPTGPGLYGDCKSGHAGIDIAVGDGANIYATQSGTVVIAEFASSDLHFSASVYGKKGIIIKGDDGINTAYAHLSADLVSNGEQVTAGQIIGKSGGSHCNKDGGDEGSCFGPHLHYEVRQNGIAQDINYMFPGASQGQINIQLEGIAKKAASLGKSDLEVCSGLSLPQ